MKIESFSLDLKAGEPVGINADMRGTEEDAEALAERLRVEGFDVSIKERK